MDLFRRIRIRVSKEGRCRGLAVVPRAGINLGRLRSAIGEIHGDLCPYTRWVASWSLKNNAKGPVACRAAVSECQGGVIVARHEKAFGHPSSPRSKTARALASPVTTRLLSAWGTALK